MNKRCFRLAAGVASVLWLAYGCGGGSPGGPGGGDDDGGAGAGGASGRGGGGGLPGFGGFSQFGGSGGASGAGGCSGDGCAPAPVCGDGAIGPGEACDDKNDVSGDGCPSDCKAIEADYACPTTGQACVSTVVCGDLRISGAETCDDGNAKAGDGCGSDCKTEDGWACPVVGIRCQAAACGDGKIAGNERCDDGDADPGDGCDDTCQFEPGFACDEPGKACVPTVCNDGKREGTEPCDDGNNDMGDGCTPACVVEPACPGEGGACKSTCGDGMHFEGDPEACDDGNLVDGDGCSSKCELEPGYQCTFAPGAEPGELALPLVLRDFKMGWNVVSGAGAQTPLPGGHPDFESNALNKGLNLGVLADALGLDGKPVYAKATGGTATTTGKAEFDQWYRDVGGLNQTLVQTMALGRLSSGVYEFDDATFFPLDGLGFGNQGQARNFHFTSEVRYWFEYKGGETLNFRGDDDVWVFINKRLVIDLGGVHGALNGSVTLGGGDGVVTQAGVTGAKTVTLGLEAGKVYEAVVLQAERHTTASNYRLTLSGFVSSQSTCQSVCGNGYVTPDEQCDDGTNDGGYGECAPGCVLGPRCGDEVVQAGEGEACDDGVNLTPYLKQPDPNKCAPGCKRPKSCGDGVVDGPFGEQCDDGANGGGYGKCAAGCVLGPRCGDGVVQAEAGEVCDDGNKVGGDGCEANCRPPIIK